MTDEPASPPSDELDFGFTLRGLRAGMKVFGRYELVRHLGRGGMGIVWLARDEKLDFEIALKFLPEALRHDIVAVDELHRETKRCLRLTHPLIVRTFDIVADDEMVAIAMEYVEGRTLAELRLGQPTRCFDADDIAPWLRQICEALNYAHQEARVVHRDLKPSNLMLEASSGRLKLADFGIASSLSDTMSRLTHGSGRSGAGTLTYMSPQQLMGSPPMVTDDTYSLGATLYELFTSRPPFFRGGIERQIETTIPPSMAERRAELNVEGAEPIPEAWEDLVAACLDKHPVMRPQTMAELWERVSDGQPLLGTASISAAPRAASGLLLRTPASESASASASASTTAAVPPLASGTTPATATTAATTHSSTATSIAASTTTQFRRLSDEARASAPPLPPAHGSTLPSPPPSSSTSSLSPLPGPKKRRTALVAGAVVLVLLVSTVAAWWLFIEQPRREQQAKEVRVQAQVERARLAKEKAEVEERARVALAAAERAQKEKADMEARQREAEAARKAKEDEQRRLAALNTPANATRERPFVNSLGMKFVPVPGTKVLFCIHETRNRDYRAYAAASPGVNGAWMHVEEGGVRIADGEDHPVTMMSWEDAKAFCVWLSKKEGLSYGLPSDHEWSLAVGIGSQENPGKSPQTLSGEGGSLFPWGTQWPPPEGAGNFADETIRTKFSGRTKIEGYVDGFGTTAPVMSFKPNTLGIHDLAGNLWEWCQDQYEPPEAWRVLRGGAWSDADRGTLESRQRFSVTPTIRESSFGFRCVLSLGEAP